jgi:hypothetical protein
VQHTCVPLHLCLCMHTDPAGVDLVLHICINNTDTNMCMSSCIGKGHVAGGTAFVRSMFFLRSVAACLCVCAASNTAGSV